MIYHKSKARQSEWIRRKVQELLAAVVRRESTPPALGGRKLNIMEDLAAPVAVELLCVVLGFKQPTPEIKEDLRVYATITSDTGERYTFFF